MSTRSSSIYSRSSSNASEVSVHAGLVHEDKLSSAPSFRRLFLLNAPEWKHALLGCSGALGFGPVQPVYAFFIGEVVSVFFSHDNDKIKSKTKIYCSIFVGLGLISVLVNVLEHYNFAAMGEYLTKRVRERMLSNILTLEVEWFDKKDNSSDLFAPDSKLATEANVAII